MLKCSNKQWRTPKCLRTIFICSWWYKKNIIFCVCFKDFIKLEVDGYHEFWEVHNQHQKDYNFEESNTKIEHKQDISCNVCQTFVIQTKYEGHESSICHLPTDCNELLSEEDEKEVFLLN